MGLPLDETTLADVLKAAGVGVGAQEAAVGAPKTAGAAEGRMRFPRRAAGTKRDDGV